MFSTGIPVFSTNKTEHHDIAEILLKVTLNTITLIPIQHDILYNCYKTRTDKLSNMIYFITVTQLEQTNYLTWFPYNCYKTRAEKLSNMIYFITVTKLEQTNYLTWYPL